MWETPGALLIDPALGSKTFSPALMCANVDALTFYIVTWDKI